MGFGPDRCGFKIAPMDTPKRKTTEPGGLEEGSELSFLIIFSFYLAARYIRWRGVSTKDL